MVFGTVLMDQMKPMAIVQVPNRLNRIMILTSLSLMMTLITTMMTIMKMAENLQNMRVSSKYFVKPVLLLLSLGRELDPIKTLFHDSSFPV